METVLSRIRPEKLKIGKTRSDLFVYTPQHKQTSAHTNLIALAVATVASRGLRPNRQLIAELVQEAETAIAADPNPPTNTVHRRRRERVIAQRAIHSFLSHILPPVKIPEKAARNGHPIPVGVSYDESSLLREDEPGGFYIADERRTGAFWRRYRAATKRLATVARAVAVHPFAVAGVEGILAGRSLSAVAKSIGIHPATLQGHLQRLARPIIQKAADDFDLYCRVRNVRRR